MGASSRAIQAAQPGTSAWNAEERAIRESSSIPWYDIGALKAPATIASEHFVWFQDGMVFKATAYGRFGHSIDKGPGKATPLEYLRRIAATNEAFNDSATIVGKFENEDGSLGLIHAQDFIEQNPAAAFHKTPEQLIHFLESLGFFPSAGHFSKYEVWAHADLGIEIADFHSGNVILNSEGDGCSNRHRCLQIRSHKRRRLFLIGGAARIRGKGLTRPPRSPSIPALFTFHASYHIDSR